MVCFIILYAFVIVQSQFDSSTVEPTIQLTPAPTRPSFPSNSPSTERTESPTTWPFYYESLGLQEPGKVKVLATVSYVNPNTAVSLCMQLASAFTEDISYTHCRVTDGNGFFRGYNQTLFVTLEVDNVAHAIQRTTSPGFQNGSFIYFYGADHRASISNIRIDTSSDITTTDNPYTTEHPEGHACRGDWTTWNAGFSSCETYSKWGHNHNYCHSDSNGGLVAQQVCPQCGKCDNREDCDQCVKLTATVNNVEYNKDVMCEAIAALLLGRVTYCKKQDCSYGQSWCAEQPELLLWVTVEVDDVATAIQSASFPHFQYGIDNPPGTHVSSIYAYSSSGITTASPGFDITTASPGADITTTAQECPLGTFGVGAGMCACDNDPAMTRYAPIDASYCMSTTYGADITTTAEECPLGTFGVGAGICACDNDPAMTQYAPIDASYCMSTTYDSTGNPTREPTGLPTRDPTGNPTRDPTGNPTRHPTGNPTRHPTGKPTREPSNIPTTEPTTDPTHVVEAMEDEIVFFGDFSSSVADSDVFLREFNDYISRAGISEVDAFDVKADSNKVLVRGDPNQIARLKEFISISGINLPSAGSLDPVPTAVHFCERTELSRETCEQSHCCEWTFHSKTSTGSCTSRIGNNICSDEKLNPKAVGTEGSTGPSSKFLTVALILVCVSFLLYCLWQPVADFIKRHQNHFSHRHPMKRVETDIECSGERSCSTSRITRMNSGSIMRVIELSQKPPTE